MTGKAAYDYRTQDCLHTAIRTDRADEMVARYRAFGWEESERKDDDRYDDIVRITFVRPHRLPEKDRLQLLQVRMEKRLNEAAALKKNAHAVSVSAGLSAGLASAAAVAGGVLLAVYFSAPAVLAAGIVLALAGAAGGVWTGRFVRRRYARETADCARRVAAAERDAADLCLQAGRLRASAYAG